MDFIRQVTASQNRFVLRISLLAALGGFLFGYDTGVVGGALPLITAKLHLSSGGESWVTGSLLLGAVAGAFMSGFLADLIGRKWTVFVAGCIYTVAAVGSALRLGLLAVAFFSSRVPETKHRSLEQIEREIRGERVASLRRPRAEEGPPRSRDHAEAAR